jgi:ubiquinone/menaquinone biosynthesis C-methylase UbiE
MMERVLEPEVMDTAEDADAYDEMDHSLPNEAFVERLVQLGARGRMLDLGTGPGHIPVMVCARIAEASVVGIDLSENMLRHAERHRAASPHRDRLSFALADAKGLAYPDASFDAVFSNTILHHIPDPRPFLAEAYRVLRRGGAFLVRDLFRPPTPERAIELVRLHAADANAYQQELLRASLHAALTPDELRAIAAELGIPATVVVDTDRHMSLQIRAATPGA